MDSSCFLELKLRQNTRTIAVTLLAILFVLSEVSLAFATRFQLNPESTQTPECNKDCSGQRPRPFCGNDGRTYMSKCEVKKARCQGFMVRKVHNGPCAVELTKCQLERAQNLLQESSSTVFIPQCNDDGSYTTVQCHKSFGYCWCVSDDGKPIPGSSVREGNATCDRQPGHDFPLADNVATFRSAPTTSLVASSTSTAAAGRNPGKTKASNCKDDKREKFNKNLKKIFMQEYARLLLMDSTPVPFASPQTNLEREKHVIEWKFSELDSNGDGSLDTKDLKRLLRLMKKIVKPKPCAKEFVSHCDLDGDRHLNEMEWSSCLGVDNISFQLFLSLNSDEQAEEPTADSGSQDASPPLLVTRQVPPGGNTEPVVLDIPVLSCENERERALEELERIPDSGILVPQCTVTGDYRAAQCHEQAQYCWCVYVDTGKPIPGTSARSSTKEDCSPLATSRGPLMPREFVDCPEHKKKRFLDKVIDNFYQEMTGTEAIPIETTTQALEELSSNAREESIIWKFGQLDRNGNVFLETKEVSPFAREIDRVKSSRKCRNNFLDYCDANQDSRLALKEWLLCFDITPTTVTDAPPRRGRNPFIDRLT